MLYTKFGKVNASLLIAGIHFGASTPSYDLETAINATFPVEQISERLVLQTLESFIGEQDQVPPIHSAKLIGGKRAYEFARKGIEKEMKPVKVYFRELELISFGIPESRVRILCSKGTYIRSFARDLGSEMGSGAYLSSLSRTGIGPFRVENALTLERFEKMISEMKQK